MFRVDRKTGFGDKDKRDAPEAQNRAFGSKQKDLNRQAVSGMNFFRRRW
jgi:hypothetical protein